MPDQPVYRKVACPSCGAPLVFRTDSDSSTRCQFCNAVVERPIPEKPKPEPDPVKPYSPHPPYRAYTIPVSPPSSERAGTVIGCLVAAVLLCGAGLFLFFVLSPIAPATFLKIPLSIVAAEPFFPSPESTAPDFIVTAYDSSADTYRVARISVVDRKVVWQSDGKESLAGLTGLAVDSGRVFLTDNMMLEAYSAEDGRLLWQAPLSDKLGYCEHCLQSAGGRVAVLAQDYTLQVFDAATGKPAWQREMPGYPREYIIRGGSLWIVEAGGEASGLLELDLAEGAQIKTLAPECSVEGDSWSNGLSNSSLVLFDPDPESDAVFFLYGWHPSCVERWSPSSGTRVWQSIEEDGLDPAEDYSTLLAGSSLFFSADNRLWKAEVASGDYRLLANPEDYELVPLILDGNTLIVRSKRTRGSAQFGLWGLDSDSGEILWETALPGSTPLDPPDPASGILDSDESAWTWRQINGSVWLLTFLAEPNQVNVSPLDLKTGTIGSPAVIPLDVSGDFYSIPRLLVWRVGIGWFKVESKLVGIDTATGSLLHSYP